MRILNLVALSTAIALALIAGPAMAQTGAVAAVTALAGAGGWSEFISVTLNQLLVASGVGVGGTAVAGIFQLVKLLISLRQSIDAGTAGKIDDSQASLIAQVIQQGVAMIAGLKQTTSAATPPVPGAPAVALTPDDVEKAVNFVRNALNGHGVTLDSDVIRGKVQAVLGDIALKLPPLPALPFPLPFQLPSIVPKPNAAQAAATTVMTGGAPA